MVKKVYLMKNLDCAHCAALIEEKLNGLPEIQEAVLTFPTRQLRITAENPDSLLEKMNGVAQAVEPDCRIEAEAPKASGSHRPHHRHEEACCCGEEQHHGDACCCGEEHHNHHEKTAEGDQKQVFMVENLDCAHCAALIEEKLNGLPEIQEAVLTFTTKQLRITAENPNSLLKKMNEVAQAVEPDCRIVALEGLKPGCASHPHREESGSQVQKKKKKSHDYDEKRDLWEVLLGTCFFVLGIALEKILPGIPLYLPAFVISYLILGWNVLRVAAKNMTRGHMFDENFLMGIATLGSFAIGEFPEAVGVMLFYRIGELFEHKAVERSRSQIMEAVDLRPENVNLMEDGEIFVIPAEEAEIGDLLLVRPGDRIPLDGTVVSGTSRIDTAPITGEPVPVSVQEGSQVVSGCVNTSGQLTIRADKLLSESMVTRILSSVENAAASKPKMDRFITRFSRVYTPAVVAIATLTAIIPSVVTGDWNYWVYTALSFLVMSCPCALVLSVPLAFFSGIGAGSKKGILFKGGLSMEAMAEIKAVVMDKTGTITKGNFVVQQVQGDAETVRLCASCEQSSTHPIAVSVVNYAREQKIPLIKPDSIEEIAGHGIRAVVDGKTVLCGNEKLMRRFSVSVPELHSGYGTQVLVAADGRYLGSIRISDTLKPGTMQTVEQLKTQGVVTAMLTGDDAATAEAVAQETGIDRVYAQLLPEDKLERLRDLRREFGPVMFVGDGINDAPVLSGADVGAAMGSGADAAIEAADVVFMTSQTAAIPESLKIAKRTKAIAWQNVIFALAVKLLVMILGLLGYASMWAAVFADSGVAMICVLNAVKILYQKK